MIPKAERVVAEFDKNLGAMRSYEAGAAKQDHELRTLCVNFDHCHTFCAHQRQMSRRRGRRSLPRL